MTSTTNPKPGVHDDICSHVKPDVIEWMQSLGFEYTSDLGDGMAFNHKLFTKGSLHVFTDQAQFFYELQEAREKLIREQAKLDALYDIRSAKYTIGVHGGTDSLYPSQRVEIVRVSSIDMKIQELEALNSSKTKLKKEG